MRDWVWFTVTNYSQCKTYTGRIMLLDNLLYSYKDKTGLVQVENTLLSLINEENEPINQALIYMERLR